MSFLISKHLITNQQYCRFLSDIPIPNDLPGGYRFLNTYLYDSRIKHRQESYYSSIDHLDKAIEQHLNTKEEFYVVPNYEKHPVVCVNWVGAYLFALALGASLPTANEWQFACRGGLEIDTLYSWGNGEPDPKMANYGEYIGTTTPIATYPANALGMYDMLGNVREWCLDGPLLNSEARYIKGGGWNKPVSHLQIDKPLSTWFLHSGAAIGFRVCFRPGTENEKK